MKENIIMNLTKKDDKYACALSEEIISESKETDEWYEYFDEFASLPDHPKSLVRNRALHILAANAQWNKDNGRDFVSICNRSFARCLYKKLRLEMSDIRPA